MNERGRYEADGSWTSEHPLFRSLTAVEVEEFRQYARVNLKPTPERMSVMHPVCVEVWEGGE
jgi:hypothetical protein